MKNNTPGVTGGGGSFKKIQDICCNGRSQYPAAWPSLRDSEAPMYTPFLASNIMAW